jgi:cation transporter-like permease
MTRNDRREVEAEMVAEKDGRELKINPTSVKWTYAKVNTGMGEGWEVRLVMDEPGQVREDQVKWLTAADFPKAVENLDRLKEEDKQRVLDMLKRFEEGNKNAVEGWAAKLKKEMTRQHGFRTGMSHSRVMPHSWGTDSVNSLFDWAFFHDRAPAGGFKDGAEWEQDLDSQEKPRYVSSIWVEEAKQPKKIKMTCHESGGTSSERGVSRGTIAGRSRRTSATLSPKERSPPNMPWSGAGSSRRRGICGRARSRRAKSRARIVPMPGSARRSRSPGSRICASKRSNGYNSRMHRLLAALEERVVGRDGKLLGIVTPHDALSILHVKASEDIHMMAGTNVVDSLHTPTVTRLKLRLPWLMLTLAGELFIALVIAKIFQPTLQRAVVLTAFMPAIMATGGNVGLQATTIIVRGLGMGTIRQGQLLRVLVSEMRLGILLGIACGIAAGVSSYLIESAHPEALKIGLAVSLAMISAASATSLGGALGPFLLHRLGRDPATACGPFVTMFNDLFGAVVYLFIAMLMDFGGAK